MSLYVARFSAPIAFEASSDDQARLILNHLAEHILEAPLPHRARWYELDETTLAESFGRDRDTRPVYLDRADRYAPVDPAAAADCPVCAEHARRQNYPRPTQENDR